MKKSYRIRVYGRVQGVAYRYSTKEIADSLSVTGYVKNMRDGSVYIEASGEQEYIEHFIRWCRKGPPMARVVNTEIEETDGISQKRFSIR